MIDSLNGALEWMFQVPSANIACPVSGPTPEDDAFLLEQTHGTRASLIAPGTYGEEFLEGDAPGDELLEMPKAANWKGASESRQVHVHGFVSESTALTAAGPVVSPDLQSFFGA